MTKALTFSFSAILLALLSVGLTAQTKKSKKINKPKPVIVATPQPTPEPPAEIPAKRNERPADGKPTSQNGSAASAYSPIYFYEFTRPGFTYERILIEHDEAGKGKIAFLKDAFAEMITDPLQLSPTTLANIKDALTALNFLDSTENYQYAAHDFSNLGNIKITVKKAGRSREVKYNWTDNKQAKFLMDEYRRIANEYTWRFELAVARQNQPLLTPGLIDQMEDYIKRGEISDPQHLTPFLTELSTDERLPLIARNHAAKIIKQIEKARK